MLNKIYAGIFGGTYKVNHQGVVYCKSDVFKTWRPSHYSKAGFLDAIDKGYLKEVKDA